MTRRIAVVTATRAEYGLLVPLLTEISRHEAIDLQLIVTGTHLAQEYGMTVEAIEADGFPISARVEILAEGDGAADAAQTMAAALEKFTPLFEEMAPDIIVLLGDRYETLAIATAATLARVPIAHIHGGELTEGAFDDAMRHAITKMAHFHFTAAEPYRRRVVQMGEDPRRTFTVGAPGLDTIVAFTPMSRKNLTADLGLDLRPPLFAVTCHPVTLAEDPAKSARALTAALDRFPEAAVVFTGVNADPGRDEVGRLLRACADRRPANRTAVVSSLGQARYLSLIAEADVMIGNSSSGVIEAPALGTPTVNIGIRQDGRLRAPSVIDCDDTAEAVERAIHKALETSPPDTIRANPLGDGRAGQRMAAILASLDLDAALEKRFVDVTPCLPTATSPITVIAEIGVNHNGSPAAARKLIDAAAAAGADVVKFQSFRAADLATAAAPKAEYQARETGQNESQLAMLSALELSVDDLTALKAYCDKIGITFLSTPFDLGSLAMLTNDLHLQSVKIGSGDLTNAPLLLSAAQRGCDVILSTGMATMDEIERALGVLAFGYTVDEDTPRGGAFETALQSSAGRAALVDKVTLLQCTTAYPAAATDLNLRAMDALGSRFGLRVGFSDHSQGVAAAIAAAARGACLIEKHITLDRNAAGPDHKASTEPDAFAFMVAAIRDVECALGDGEKRPLEVELANKQVARKSLVARQAIAKGEVFTTDNLTVKRPETGIPANAYFDWLGRRAERDFHVDEVIS